MGCGSSISGSTDQVASTIDGKPVPASSDNSQRGKLVVNSSGRKTEAQTGIKVTASKSVSENIRTGNGQSTTGQLEPCLSVEGFTYDQEPSLKSPNNEEEQHIKAVKAKLQREWAPEYMPQEILPPQYSPDVHSERATSVTLGMILKEQEHLIRKTKIVCTIGPACDSEEMLGKLLDAGMNVMRMNFSHGDHSSHKTVLDRFRKVCSGKGVYAATMLDTKGPEIRTAMLRGHKAISLEAGQEIIVEAVGEEYTSWEGFKDPHSGETRIGLSYAKLCNSVSKGNRILLADGSISIEVLEILTPKTLKGRVLNSKTLGERKNCNLPGVKVDIPVLTAKDVEDLQRFAANFEVDFVAASFVQSSEDVKLIRRVLDSANGYKTKIISKIENLEGLQNFDEILKETDGVMVARGDLGMEIPSEKVPVAQKMMITKCNIAGKFVICATQMLESMCAAPRPTRAEMTDVANAVYDGVDCVMLSGETAGGQFPYESVSTMAKIVANAETGVDYYSQYSFIRYWATQGNKVPQSNAESVLSSAASMAVAFSEDTAPEVLRKQKGLEPSFIVVASQTGLAAALICKYRPPCPTVVISSDDQVLRQGSVSFSLTPLKISSGKQQAETLAAQALKRLQELGMVAGNNVKAIVALGRDGGPADQDPMVTVVKLGNKINKKGWSTNNSLFVMSGAMIQRPGVRSLRSTLTSLHLITTSIKKPRSTHIICTMGPACWSEDTLAALLGAGMDVIRLNFSHGDHDSHLQVLERFRKVCKKKGDELKEQHGLISAPQWATLLDTKGPEIRTAMLRDHKAIELVSGQEIIVEAVGDAYTSWEGFKDEFTGETRIGLSYVKLCSSVTAGSRILLADGSLSIEVVEILNKTSLKGRVLNTKILGERKNCNLPGAKVDIPVLTDKDINDLKNFAVKYDMDYVAASFVQSAADVKFIRKVLDDAGGYRVKIISKIENAEGLINFDEIMRESDGIMVARGDLGMEIPAEKVPLAQKMMVTKCNIAGKFVICATQMLESMITNPRPTRAEMTDVANAVLDGVDCVMVSGETANGEFPVDTVATMAAICQNAEQMVDARKTYDFLRNHNPKPMTGVESICSGAVQTAIDIGAKAILCITNSGRGPLLVSKYRPSMPVVVVTPDSHLVHNCRTSFGQVGILFNHNEEEDIETIINRVVQHCRQMALADIQDGDQLVLLLRQRYPHIKMYDDQRMVMKTVVVGNHYGAVNVPHTAYRGLQTVYHRSTKIGLDTILDEEKFRFVVRKTKVVCTMGPSCWSEEMLPKLISAGMNVVRLNFSHGDHEAHQATLDRVRKVATRMDKMIATLLDTKGPEIRTAMLRGHKAISLEAGQEIIVEAVGEEYSSWEGFKDPHSGETRIGLSYGKLCSSVSKGNRILLADGSLSIEVLEILSPKTLKGRVLNSNTLGERKNCNLPGVKVDIPVLTSKDIGDLQNFAAKNKMDFVAASFVQSKEDVLFIRKVLDEAGGKEVKIISKIENAEGLKNFDDILEVTDGVMVARGDLGMEIPVEKVPLAQKMMITKSNIAGKFVICATQMLESMVKNPIPTRAEMTDVANAVIDGADAVMLSGETANGAYPDIAVQTMANICRSAELGVNLYQVNDFIRQFTPKPVGTLEAVASALVKHSVDVRPGMLIVFSEGGLTARLVAKYRPSVPVLVVTSSPVVARHAAMLFAMYPMLLPKPIQHVSDLPQHVLKALEWGVQQGLCVPGKEVVVLTSAKVASSSNMARPEGYTRRMYVTLAPGQLETSSLGTMAPVSSISDPKMAAKMISLRSTVINYDMLVSDHAPERKTKIGVTLGMATESAEVLAKLVDGGMNLARINFVHGTMEQHTNTLQELRKICEQKQRYVAVMLDLEGNTPRCSYLVDKLTRKPVKNIQVNQGDIITLYGSEDQSPDKFIGWKDGDDIRVGVSLPDFGDIVQKGKLVRMADGVITVEVLEVKSNGEVKAKVLNSGHLYARRPLVIVGVKLHTTSCSEKDWQIIQDFAIKYSVDYIAAPSVSGRHDIESLRSFLDECGGEAVRIVARVETSEGLVHMDEILEVADAIMLARGSLGTSITPEKVELAQSMSITKANLAGKPIIISRQLLDSMVSNPRPTRAEMTDVANAVLDCADCIMLCTETAEGSFPVEALATASNLVRNAEAAMSYRSQHSFVRDFSHKPFSTLEAAASGMVRAAMDAAVNLCLVFSDSGAAAQLVCKYRPPVPVVVVTSQAQVMSMTQLAFGQFGFELDLGTLTRELSEVDVDGMLRRLSTWARSRGLPHGPRIALLHGATCLNADAVPVIKVLNV